MTQKEKALKAAKGFISLTQTERNQLKIDLLQQRIREGVLIKKETREAYKIFVKENEDIKNLFKSVEGSRTIPKGKWLEAEKKWSYDGANRSWYLSGIHCLPTYEDAKEYLNNFRTNQNRIIKKVIIENYHSKPTNEKVMLAHKIKLVN